MRIKQSVAALAMAAMAFMITVSAMPAASATTPAAAGVAMSSGAHSFKDINSRSAFRTEIVWLADRGISTGYADHTFRPFGAITRDAMAAFMYRLAGKPAFTPPARSPFKDITPSTQFYKEITWLASTGVTTGYADNTYRPFDSATRDAMAAFMYRLAGKPSYTAPSRSPFSDIRSNSKFYKEITWLADAGISKGWSSDNTYRPFLSIERNAMAAFMYRFDHEVGVNVSSNPAPPVAGPTDAEIALVHAQRAYLNDQIGQSNARIDELNADLVLSDYRLMVAEEYGDTLRASQISAEISRINADIDSERLYGDTLRAERDTLPNW